MSISRPPYKKPLRYLILVYFLFYFDGLEKLSRDIYPGLLIRVARRKNVLRGRQKDLVRLFERLVSEGFLVRTERVARHHGRPSHSYRLTSLARTFLANWTANDLALALKRFDDWLGPKDPEWTLSHAERASI